jgi:hypothetical protein
MNLSAFNRRARILHFPQQVFQSRTVKKCYEPFSIYVGLTLPFLLAN